MFSATDIDPRPGAPHANGAAYRRISAQVKTPPYRGRCWSFGDESTSVPVIRIPTAGAAQTFTQIRVRPGEQLKSG